jgi:transaldolase
MKTKIYLDSGDINELFKYNNKKNVHGFTTNPSILKKNKIKYYRDYAKKILKRIKLKPISFEVFGDDFKNIYFQAKEISSWGKNIFVKIPIVNSKGDSNLKIIKKLSSENIKINITAIFTIKQIKDIAKIKYKNKLIISVFSGRIADTGRDPENYIKFAIKLFRNKRNVQILWASPREIYNLYQAKKIGCHIITLPLNLIEKKKLYKKNLKQYSIETSKDFFKDSKSIKFI